MTIAAVRTAIGTALSGISSLKSVNDQVPDAIPKLPATVASLERVRYHETLEGCIVQEWRILLLIAERTSEAAHDVLDQYVAVSGSASIKAAIEDATDIGDDATVVAAENLGHILYRGSTFIGAEFIVEVLESV